MKAAVKNTQGQKSMVAGEGGLLGLQSLRPIFRRPAPRAAPQAWARRGGGCACPCWGAADPAGPCAPRNSAGGHGELAVPGDAGAPAAPAGDTWKKAKRLRRKDAQTSNAA